MRLREMFDYAAIGGLVLGGVMMVRSVSALMSVPSTDSMFKKQVYNQVQSTFAEVPAEGVHDVRIDFGKARADARAEVWGHVKWNGGFLVGGGLLAVGSGLFLSSGYRCRFD